MKVNISILITLVITGHIVLMCYFLTLFVAKHLLLLSLLKITNSMSVFKYKYKCCSLT